MASKCVGVSVDEIAYVPNGIRARCTGTFWVLKIAIH